jgi:hypothetical protein
MADATYRGMTFCLKVTVAPKNKNVKDNRDSFLLNILLATRETVANNMFNSIPQWRLHRKIVRGPQSDGMTWRIFRI